MGIAVGSPVYVADHGNARIQVFDADGNLLHRWGTPGSGDGQFSGGRAIAIGESGYVYVAESGNNRVQVFDADGNFPRKWGTPGDGDGQLLGPDGIVVDNGMVYVADSGNHRIQVFDANGNFLRKWGTEGAGDGQFNEPKGIEVDGSGRVYVADTLPRIHRRTSLGTALEEASGCSSESGIMVLEQKPARKQGAPNRCCHRTNPTVSASSLTTIAWWPMPACSCRPP